MVVEGDARVTIDGTEVATVGADDIIGEMGPIEDRPKAATVSTTTHMITYAISRERLHQVRRSNQAAADVMKNVLAARYGQAFPTKDRSAWTWQ